jgi:nucleotide-binding universal stress UspA family protein
VDTGPVVVGVDEDSSGTIIGHAFEVASLRGAQVLAITVQSHGGPQARSARHTAEAVLGSDLDSLLDPWREKYPDVPAKREVVRGRPDKVLVERSRAAQLVVVGPRRHGVEGVMLGSVGTRLARPRFHGHGGGAAPGMYLGQTSDVSGSPSQSQTKRVNVS